MSSSHFPFQSSLKDNLPPLATQNTASRVIVAQARSEEICPENSVRFLKLPDRINYPVILWTAHTHRKSTSDGGLPLRILGTYRHRSRAKNYREFAAEADPGHRPD